MRFKNLILAFSLLAAPTVFADTATPPAGAGLVMPVVSPSPVAIDRAKLRTALGARRKLVIQRFLAYRDAKVYPIARTPGAHDYLWVDAGGHFCAAATLVSLDWGRPAAWLVGQRGITRAMADQRSGALNDWILTSGLARHELVAIQVLPVEPDPRPVVPDGSAPGAPPAETERLHAIYMDVERQLVDLADDSLDEATDALMKRPDLAQRVLAGGFAGPGEFTPER
jgi:hypothetical protein